MIITGLEVSDAVMERSLAAAHDLFALSAGKKRHVAIKNNVDSFGRGYLGFGDESGVATNFEPKEGYSYGSPLNTELPPRNLLSTPNRWPNSLSSVAVRALESLYTWEVNIAQTIVAALSSQFQCGSGDQQQQQPEGVTLQDIAEGGGQISLMRLFHYFNLQSPEVQAHLTRSAGSAEPGTGGKRLLGSSPHTDWGFLTLILADDVGGLQFLRRGGDVRREADWMDVPHISGSLVVNGGDYLSLVTKGVYHSPIHRVLTPGTDTSSSTGVAQAKDRHSFVLFFYPTYSSPVSADVLGHCAHRSHPAAVAVQADTGTETAARISPDGEASPSQSSDSATSAAAGTGEYNTLLRLDKHEAEGSGREGGGGGSSGPRAFGDYVIRKWQGVYRAE